MEFHPTGITVEIIWIKCWVHKYSELLVNAV